MFSANTDRLVDQLCYEEWRSAVDSWGPTYSSEREAGSVLSEELHEVMQEINLMNKSEDTRPMIRYAKNAMKELAQVVAVCMKIDASSYDD